MIKSKNSYHLLSTSYVPRTLYTLRQPMRHWRSHVVTSILQMDNKDILSVLFVQLNKVPEVFVSSTNISECLRVGWGRDLNMGHGLGCVSFNAMTKHVIYAL